MDQPLVSVIIPVYNMERYLERCLDSVLNNTYRNLEVICIDDGSKDRSLEILRRYGAADPRVVVIAKENGGVSSARNAGLDRMTGEYVTFVDPDDYVHPQYIDLLIRSLMISKQRIAICGFEKVNEHDSFTMPAVFTLAPTDVKVVSFVEIFKTHNLRSYCWGKILCADLVKHHRFITDLKLAEDTAFVAEVCEDESSNEAAVLSFPLYYYCQREGSAVKIAKTSDLLQFGKAWVQMLRKSNRDDIYLHKAFQWFLSIRYESAYIILNRHAVRECNSQLKKILPFLLRTRTLSLFERLSFCVFIVFPRLYWLHRVVGDPSMLQWEKIERKKRREEKRLRGIE